MVNLDYIIGACFWITTRCNLRCHFCYADLNIIDDNKFECYLEIINKLHNLGIKKIAFTGGEPLIVKDIYKLLEFTKGLDIKVALTTNGILLNKNLIKKLEYVVDELSIPLEGYSKETSHLHRTNKFNHYGVIDIINLSLELNLKIDVSTVVTNKNIHELEGILFFLNSKGIKKWKIFQYSSLNNKCGSCFVISEKDFGNAIANLIDIINSHNMNIEIDYRYNDKDSINSYLNILPNGDIFLSKNNSYVNVGNILDVSSKSELIKILKENNFSFQIHYKRHFRDL